MELIQPLRKQTRIGAYGVVIADNSLLLVEKQGGCYKGLLDLPGGGIEWGESPEQALRREFAEETAMGFIHMEWIANLSHTRDVLEENFRFHQLGLIYRVLKCTPIENAIAEERFAWYPLSELALETLTPFAQAAVERINH